MDSRLKPAGMTDTNNRLSIVILGLDPAIHCLFIKKTLHLSSLYIKVPVLSINVLSVQHIISLIAPENNIIEPGYIKTLHGKK